MKISRMSEEKIVPEWIFQNKQATEYIDKEVLSSEEVNRILSLSCDVSEDDIIIEKDRIEHCASSQSPYYYNMQWSDGVKSELKEYAVACNMDMNKFKAVDLNSLTGKITAVASESKMVKTASAVVAEPTKMIVDAFKIDEKIADSHEKTKWTPELKNASKLAEKPTMSGIVPVRGGEDYFANNNPQIARGQNSISDPNAIGKLAENQDEDNGARLRRENKEKEEAKKTRHAEWQKEKIDAMEQKEILPNRHVFPTESLNAQPGIKGDVFDFNKVPEKTLGETLKQANQDRKEQIRGKEKAKYEFILSQNPTCNISENFADELKKHLGQID